MTQLSQDDQVASRRLVAQSGAWVITGKLFGKLVDFASLLVLAHLLLPADFALVAMAMTVLLLIEAVTEVPLTHPIVRASDADRSNDLYDTAFTLGLCRSGIVLATVLLTAPLAASYYREPRLVPLLGVLAMMPVLRSLASPKMADFVRSFNTAPVFISISLAKLCSFGAIYLTATATGNYWAIAAGTVTGPAVMCLISYIAAPYRPRLSIRRWSAFSHFIGWSSLNQIFSALNFQADRFVLGRALPAQEFGRYSVSTELASTPFQGILQPLFGPLTAAFARSRSLAYRAELWKEVLGATLLLIGPILLGLGLMADELVYVFLGPRWEGAGWYLRWIAITSLPGAISHVMAPMAVASFRTEVVAARTAAELGLKLPLTIVGVAWMGVEGALWARGVAGLFGAIAALEGAKNLTGVRITDQLRALTPVSCGLAAFSIAVGVLSMPFEAAALETDTPGRLALGAVIVVITVVGLSVQLIATFGLWRFTGCRPGVESRLASITQGWLARQRQQTVNGQVEETKER